MSQRTVISEDFLVFQQSFWTAQEHCDSWAISGESQQSSLLGKENLAGSRQKTTRPAFLGNFKTIESWLSARSRDLRRARENQGPDSGSSKEGFWARGVLLNSPGSAFPAPLILPAVVARMGGGLPARGLKVEALISGQSSLSDPSGHSHGRRFQLPGGLAPGGLGIAVQFRSPDLSVSRRFVGFLAGLRQHLFGQSVCRTHTTARKFSNDVAASVSVMRIGGLTRRLNRRLPIMESWGQPRIRHNLS